MAKLIIARLRKTIVVEGGQSKGRKTDDGEMKKIAGDEIEITTS